MIQYFSKYLTLSIQRALKPNRLYVSLLAAILISPFSIQQSLAEDTESTKAEEPRWFEVEVILYKANSELGLSDESWAADTEFSLPENLIDFLQPFSQPELNQADDEQSSNSSQTSSPISDALESVNTAPVFTNSGKIQFANEEDITEQLGQIEQELALEKPFVLLTEADFQLQTEAQRVSRNSRYTLLSHFSWRQPVLGRRDSQPVRIAGGTDFQELFDYAGTEKIEYIEDTLSEQKQQNTNGTIQDITDANIETKTNKMTEHENALLLENKQEFVPIALPWVPEIDGSMRVYIQRNYLHIDTKLFYRRPDKEEVNALDLTKSMLVSNGNHFPLSDTPENIFSEATAIEAPILTGFSSIEKDSSHLSTSNTDDVTETQSNDDANNFVTGQDQNNAFGFKFDEEFLHRESEKIYITRLFNYPLKQTRRLRSGELHYFDHPLIGMLVMIRPYERFIDKEFDSLEPEVLDRKAISVENAKILNVN